MKNTILCLSIFAGFIAASCNNRENTSENNANQAQKSQPAEKYAPEFNADSAYAYVQKQVDFGPRVPNTKAHDACARYLENKLREFTPDVQVQTGDVKAFNGTVLHISNIIGTIHPEKHRKILLCAHWDSRPWADQDSVDTKKPIDAANDAGSGIAVMLEIARDLQKKSPDIGVIILMEDAEDYGQSSNDDSYALGAQYWAKSLDKTKYVADYGILLDMVGAYDARFLQEGFSMKFAPNIVDRVWQQAQLSGAANYFIMQPGGGITDDHMPINEIASIPTIDIVDYDQSRPKGFAYYWHTHADNMKVIDKNTLKAVGQTLLDLIFTEKGS